MSERTHQHQADAEDLAQQHQHAAPNTDGSYGTGADETAELPLVTSPDEVASHDASEDIGTLDALEAAFSQDDDEVEEENSEGLGDVDAAVAADMAKVEKTGARKGGLRRKLSKLNPGDLVRQAHARIATGEFTRKALKVGKYAGALALLGTAVGVGVSAYMKYKGHDVGGSMLGSIARNLPTEGHDNGTGTDLGGQIPAPAETDTTVYHRAAVEEDLSGRASNVTDWSRETIREEALKAGLNADQANTLARDQHNVNTANQAFYNDNEAVAHDKHHYMNEGTSYDTTGMHRTAHDIVEQYKVDHGMKGDVNAAINEQQPTEARHGYREEQNVAADTAKNPSFTETHPTAPPASEGPRKKANIDFAMIAGALVGSAAVVGGMIAGSHAVNKLEERKRARDIDNKLADYRQHLEALEAEKAGRNPADIPSHRRSRSRRRKHAKPMRHSNNAKKPNLHNEEEPAARID
jgi:hypothetical protein